MVKNCMPPEKMEPGSPEDWLRHARSDLELAKVKRPKDVMFEELCFHTQKAAEKSLKSVLIYNKMPINKTHNLRTLVDMMPESISIPEYLDEAAGLTDFAVIARYPGESEPVDFQEYKDSIKSAQKVFDWSRKQITRK